MSDRPRLFERHADLDLENPVMFVCLEGWVDAGQGLHRVTTTMMRGAAVRLASFDPDQLVDYRSRRPIMHVDDGVNIGLTWPHIEVLALKDHDGRDVVLLTGVEPDLRWREFCADVLELAQALKVRLVMALGAYPAAIPHTRDVVLSSTGTTPVLIEKVGHVDGKMDVPAGIHAAIERECADRGIPSVGLWAPVPHYAASLPYPAAAIALLNGVKTVADRTFSYSELVAEAATVEARLDNLMAESDEHEELLEQLEAHADNVTDVRIHDDVPSGDDLADQLQRFLEELDERDADSELRELGDREPFDLPPASPGGGHPSGRHPSERDDDPPDLV